MVSALFDTNILIDYLNSIPQALREYDLYNDVAISSVSWIEVLVGANASNETATRRFLGQFEIITLDEVVSEEAAVLRHRYKLKLADAISWASARVTGRLFVTRDAKDFADRDPGIRIPYRI
jgi:predicted nucleic acid-binding protein